MDKRPILTKQTAVIDFQEFYWLKEELIAFCKVEGLKTTGSKTEINNRIESYLLTGTSEKLERTQEDKPTSRFDWNKEKLSSDTLITDNYKNTENVRMFFRQYIGNSFKFNVQFMSWMKSNVGRTLMEAAEEWKSINANRKTNKRAKEIAPQFEYNKYLRDFLAANPNSNRDEGIRLWNIKKSLRGDNSYVKEDWKLI